MNEKNTEELSEILKHTHISEFGKFRDENLYGFSEDQEAFSIYIKELLTKRGITQQKVFLNADIPERYGYKLLSGEKRTKQRDVILRICYAAELSLDETQKALRKYGMPELYAKKERDAVLMIVFNERPGSIIDVNSILKENDLLPLRTSGIQE
ncbi:MAG: hypothetical protein E7273_06930 [Pseudobutyrivibrio ruminis]|nr:hypothetical protein [Pseudobutyrivibrio ruminis]